MHQARTSRDAFFNLSLDPLWVASTDDYFKEANHNRAFFFGPYSFDPVPLTLNQGQR